METIQDIDRPDVMGTPPKMASVCEAATSALNAAWLKITTDDNICSSIHIRGSLDPRETWGNGIFENSRYFRFFIRPMGGRRYYSPDDPKVTVELISMGSGMPKFRKSTSNPGVAIARIKAWLAKAT